MAKPEVRVAQTKGKLPKGPLLCELPTLNHHNEILETGMIRDWTADRVRESFRDRELSDRRIEGKSTGGNSLRPTTNVSVENGVKVKRHRPVVTFTQATRSLMQLF